jgi:methyl-accepting chemotaxis protein
MFSRFKISVLLKTVISVLATGIVIMLALGAWDSWNRLAAATRIANVTEASTYLFIALHTVRSERSATVRELNSDQQTTSLDPQVKEGRDVLMSTFKSGLAAMEAADFPGRQDAIAVLNQAVTKHIALQQESAAAFTQPMAARRPGLWKEYFKAGDDVMAALEKTSAQMAKSVMLEDAYVDQLLDMKQLGFMARNAAGDASGMILNALGGLPLPPDPLVKYAGNMGRLENVWAALEDIASRMSLPSRLTAAIEAGRNGFLGPEDTAFRMKTLKSLMAGEKLALTPREVSMRETAQLATLVGASEAALDVAKEHTAAQRTWAQRRLWGQLALLLATVALSGAMFLLVTRRVTGPLVKIQQAMLKLAAGDFSVVLPGLNRKDEIGDVSNAVERFKVLSAEKARTEAAEAVQRQQVEADRQSQLARAEAGAQAKIAAERARAADEQTQAIKALGTGMAKLSSGDLTFRLTEAFPETYKELKDNFNKTMTELQETIRALTDSAREVTSASVEISTGTTDLSQRTEEQAASLEQTSASMEEISSTVKKNAENAQVANSSASATRDVADRGGQVVAQAVQAMARIEDSSRKISDIIGVIDEIARQTNLLALNAAVEAARAGDAGRGFAVVASEVRSLAQRSSQAAKDIKDLITNSNGQVKDGVELVNRAGASLTEIVDSIKKVAEIIAGIANASNEQAAGIEQVNKALTQMDEVTQQNSALVEENAATAKTLEYQAKAMDERVAFFRIDGGAAGGHPVQPAKAREQRALPVAPSRGPAAPTRIAAGSNDDRPVRRMRAALATAVKSEPDWKEF